MNFAYSMADNADDAAQKGKDRFGQAPKASRRGDRSPIRFIRGVRG
jgi:hypothetical protein